MSYLGLKHPLIVAPMAGGPTTPSLVAASSAAGALGSLGAAYLEPQAITKAAAEVRALTDRPFAINLFAPQKGLSVPQQAIAAALQATRAYREELRLPEPKLKPPFEESFEKQFEATLRSKPFALSYVFGPLGADRVRETRRAGILVIGTATTPEEALAIEAEGADAVTLQGFEAGGHRGIFDPAAADRELPLRALLRETKISVPRIAAGGLMNAGDIRGALALGASAVQLGTAFLACRETGTSAAYREALRGHRSTKTTRVFSGRLARGIANRFVTEMESGKPILPFPAQNKLTRDLRNASAAKGSADFLSLWSGTGEGELFEGSAAELIRALFPRAMKLEQHLLGAVLVKKPWREPRPGWDHDHCELCWATLMEKGGDKVFTEGYWCEREQTWICPRCFDEHRVAYGWVEEKQEDR